MDSLNPMRAEGALKMRRFATCFSGRAKRAITLRRLRRQNFKELVRSSSPIRMEKFHAVWSLFAD